MSSTILFCAAIGGKPQQIKQFVKSLPSKSISDELEILKEFKIVNLAPDFSIFVYAENFPFFSKKHTYAGRLWKRLTYLMANKNLSHICYRFSNVCYFRGRVANYETQSNDDELYYDERINDLFALNFSLDIQGKYLISAFN